MSIPVTILTSRFNNKTWSATTKYRENENIKCIYCCPNKITEEILPNSLLLIIEMNNDKNEIEGIGLIRNKIRFDKRYIVHEEGNYNRYIYTGDYRIDTITLSQHNPHLVETLNKILFKGKSHSKRGRGLLKLPKIGGRDPLSLELRSYCNQELLSIIRNI
jgi:hypothetical protein